MGLEVFLKTYNGQPVSLSEVPTVSLDAFRKEMIETIKDGNRLVAFFGRPEGMGLVRLMAVLAHDVDGELFLLETVVGQAYPAIASEVAQAHWFEREIAEQWGVRPEGHPWLKPIRFHKSYHSGQDAWNRPPDKVILPSVTDFFQVSGEEIHEVAVGPVHAGVIEPGHFRFQCHGEEVYHLEISMGYQHRGVERALPGGPNRRSVHYMETLAGDTTIGHTTAYCQALEALMDCMIPARAQVLRAVALELERLANHVGDLGALANDVGYLPTAAYCGRLRGDFLNMSALLCGNRFGRGFVRPGGTRFDLDVDAVLELRRRIETIFEETTVAVDLLWKTPSVLARFEETGTISRRICRELGLVGPVARACGIERDCRYDFPAGLYALAHIPVATAETGDVFARAFVRWLEIQRSVAFLLEQLQMLPSGPIQNGTKGLKPASVVVSLVEGWRGEICHVALTDGDGNFERYKIVDPSFHNWMGLAMALRNQQISDFPLCNKSFNLSYCGHDL